MHLYSSKKVKLKPELYGDGFWMIGDNPDLGELQGKEGQECVDHHVFQSVDGKWHLWGCVRGTKVGRVLYHWEAENITDEHWDKTGEIIRVDRNAGESINDWGGEEWIQSPFIVKENDLYYMFYGGHGTGTDEYGNPIEEDSGSIQRLSCKTASQMCLMTSRDGRKWTRHRNEKGQSRIFIGPGEVRDPVLIKIEGTWHMYYAGCHFEGNNGIPAIYMRTSKDLIAWSDWKVVHYDLSPQFGAGRWNHECPHVVQRGGYFFLFRTQNYHTPRTHVFRSEDPTDFGIGDAREKYIGLYRVAAPEIIVGKDGQEYITSSHNLKGGTMICKLKWVEE